MNDCADLCVKTLIVLSLLCQSDVGELLLEIKSVSHLVEQEGEEEISPVFFKSEPALLLAINNTAAKLVALGDNRREIASDQTSHVEEGMEPVLFGFSVGPQGDVVLIVHDIVEHKDDGLETLVSVIVEVVQLESKEESVKVVESIG
jgi:hypothetical protein